MSGYFTYFPSLVYANTATTNIIAKVRFAESVAKHTATFYPYTVLEGQRPDQIAEEYYQDSSFDWIVYLCNDIVDPYHQWPKDENSFNAYITAKYGSVANAQQQTAFYKNNYEFDDRVISPAAYDALSLGQKKYWAPIVGYNDQVANYQRKAIEQVVETNKVISIAGTFGSFTESTLLKQSSSVQGTVAFANSSTIVLKHVSGTWQSGSTVYYTVDSSVANATVTSVTTLSEPIPSEEVTYWSSYSHYTVEQEKNENNKHIRLLNPAYIDLIERDMRDLLSA